MIPTRLLIYLKFFMSKKIGWQQVSRTILLDSKFLKVYQDRVLLPDNSERDYFLNKKSDIVVIVATTPNEEIIILDEYKYAAGKYMTVLPAGHIENNEDVVEAAKRELREETGYEGKEYVYLGQLYEAPVQDLHQIHVVRVKDAQEKTHTLHENSEDITTYLITKEKLKEKILNNQIQSCSTLGALSLSELI